MKRTLQFAWKFRRWQMLGLGAMWPVVIFCGLAHVGSPWMLIALIGLPAILIESAVKKEVNVGRCMEQLGKMTLHNANEDGIPSNAAWNLAVLDIRRHGHLHAYVDARYDMARDRIILDFA